MLKWRRALVAASLLMTCANAPSAPTTNNSTGIQKEPREGARSPNDVAASKTEVGASAQLPGATIQTATVVPDIRVLIAASEKSPKGQFETAEAFLSRISPPPGEAVQLVRLPPQGSSCGPQVSYDADAKFLSVNIVHLAGVIAISCDNRSVAGIAPGAGILKTFHRFPMAPADAEAVWPNLQLWISFRRAASVERGSVWKQLPSTMTALVASDIELWVSDDTGTVLHKHRFDTLSTQELSADTAFPAPDDAGAIAGMETGTTTNAAASTVTGPPKMSLSAACARPDRVAAVAATYDPLTLYDLRIQLKGLQMNGMELGTTWDQYLARRIEERCKVGAQTQGWTFPIDFRAHTFRYPGEVWCRSGNTGGSNKHDCNEKYPAELPVGWQVCRVRFKHRKWRHGALQVIPIAFPGDEHPPRSKGITFHITGHGDVGNTSGVRVWDLEIDALVAGATLQERKDRDCEITATSPSAKVSPPIKPPQPQGSPPNLSAHLINIGTHVATLVLSNTGGTSGMLCWRVVALDGDDEKWDDVDSGCQTIAAFTQLTRGLSKMRNRGWKVFQ